MATIGRKAAIAELLSVGPLKLPAWWLWGVVQIAFLVGARNCLPSCSTGPIWPTAAASG
jgi:hypothetical protein